MKVREMSLPEFGDLVLNRYRSGIDSVKKLKSEFDTANATYQMVHKNSTPDAGGDSSLARFISELEGSDHIPDGAKGESLIMGAESLYGALFLHSKLCVTDPASHCIPNTNDYEDMLAAKYGTLFIKYLEGHLSLANTIESTIYLDASIYGNGIAFVGWNSNKGVLKKYDKESGELEMSGDFEVRRVSPYNFVPQPNCTRLEDCEWCFEKHEISVEELCFTYPEKSEQIREFHRQHEQERKSRSDTDYDTPQGVEKNETVTVLEYWEKHLPWNGMHGRHAIFLTYEESQNNKEPVMKCVHIEGNPYNHGGLPFVMLSDIDVAGSLWGLGRLVLCQPMQDTIDRILSIVYDNSELHGQLHLVVPDGTHNPDNLNTDDPTHVFKYNAAMANGQKPMQMQPGTVSGDFWRQYGIYKDQISSIFGAGEFSTGEINRELSGFAVLTAIDADDKFRIRLFNKKVHMLKTLYKKLLSVGQQFLDEGETIRVAGQERSAAAQMFKVADLKGSYDVHVGFGKFMPTDPSAAKEYMFQLLQTGLFQEAGGDPKKLLSLLLDGNLVELQNYSDGARAVQESENVRILNGSQMPVFEYQDHESHLGSLNEMMNTSFFESLPTKIKELFEAHAKAHVDILAELSAQAGATGGEQAPAEGMEPPPM